MEAAAGDVTVSAPQPVSVLGEIHDKLTPESIRDFIIGKTDTLIVRPGEKKEFGEVFTPVSLINEMLNKLPEHVWTNRDLKWLDPAAGIGNFPMVVYERLMCGLESVIPTSSERRDHIIQNMLYMVEFNRESCDEITRTFGTAANLFHGDSINDVVRFNKLEDVTSQFDVIVGNPPYNAPQKSQGKPGGGSTLWNQFVDKSLDEWLKPGGYMTFVHPSGWRKPPSTCSIIKHLFEKMVHRNYMSYLEIHSKCDGTRIFGAQTRFDFYVIEKRPPKPSERTTVVDQEGVKAQLDLRTWKSFLPNHSFVLIRSLLAGTKQDYVIYSRCQYGTDKRNKFVQHSPPSVEYPYPLIHTIIRRGPKIYSTNVIKESPPMFYVPKIVMTESGIRNGVYPDPHGRVGMTHGAFGIKLPIKSKVEEPLMKKALESQMFAQIVDAMSFGNFRVDRNMFSYFRPDFYKDPLFHNSPRISTISKYTKCDGGKGEDEDDCEDECEGGGGAVVVKPAVKLVVKPAVKPAVKLVVKPVVKPVVKKIIKPRTGRNNPSGKSGGRTCRRRHHRTTIKLRKYKKQRHTRKKLRLH